MSPYLKLKSWFRLTSKREQFDYTDCIGDNYSKVKDNRHIKLYFYTLILVALIPMLIGFASLHGFIKFDNGQSKVFFFCLVTFCCMVPFYKRIPRSCLSCHKKMIYFKPHANDTETTYKYICHSCKVYIDTQQNNDTAG